MKCGVELVELRKPMAGVNFEMPKAGYDSTPLKMMVTS